ncbi:MAG: hypothetical protein ACTSUM_04085, partial [Alphaproteobacteria bacterium]
MRFFDEKTKRTKKWHSFMKKYKLFRYGISSTSFTHTFIKFAKTFEYEKETTHRKKMMTMILYEYTYLSTKE